jgi:hypothetical protein
MRLKNEVKQKGKYCSSFYLYILRHVTVFKKSEQIQKKKDEKYVQYRADTNRSYSHQTASDSLF